MNLSPSTNSGRYRRVRGSRKVRLGLQQAFLAFRAVTLLLGLCLPSCQKSWAATDEGPKPSVLDGEYAAGGELAEDRQMPRRHAGDLKKRPKAQGGQATVEQVESSPWASPEVCEAILAKGARAQRHKGMARLATWNIRWFPDGVPGHVATPEQGTDLKWLACVIAWLNIDALALQEVKIESAARAKLDTVIADLDARTGDSWSVIVDQCSTQNGQHVAWLYDLSKVKATDFIQYASVNPRGSACADQLRPGLGVTLTFPGGLDLQAITIHLKSGVTQRDVELRRRSWSALSEVIVDAAKRTRDSDVLIMGDFNSMGCRSCEFPYGSTSELADLDRQLRVGELPARRIGADFPCSHYFQKQPGLLDHVVVTEATRELSTQVRATVEGYCRSLNCEPFSGSEPNAYRRLSDHCPVVIELADRDLD